MIVTTAEYINQINLFVVSSVFPKIDFEKLLEVGLRYFKRFTTWSCIKEFEEQNNFIEREW